MQKKHTKKQSGLEAAGPELGCAPSPRELFIGETYPEALSRDASCGALLRWRRRPMTGQSSIVPCRPCFLPLFLPFISCLEGTLGPASLVQRERLAAIRVGVKRWRAGLAGTYWLIESPLARSSPTIGYPLTSLISSNRQ